MHAYPLAAAVPDRYFFAAFFVALFYRKLTCWSIGGPSASTAGLTTAAHLGSLITYAHCMYHGVSDAHGSQEASGEVTEDQFPCIRRRGAHDSARSGKKGRESHAFYRTERVQRRRDGSG